MYRDDPAGSVGGGGAFLRRNEKNAEGGAVAPPFLRPSGARNPRRAAVAKARAL